MLATGTILALILAWLPTVARADGDPASDVLASQPLFLPQDAGVPIGQQGQIGALLGAAGRAGYTLRVALIASPVDLGSVTELWRRPEPYAHYLGQELSLVYRGSVLVVMPDGFGLYRVSGARAAERRAVATLRAPGASLGTATLGAIQRLAAAAGHQLPVPRPLAPASPASTNALAWLAFAIGAVLITVAWTLSLRARPLRGREAGRASS